MKNEVLRPLQNNKTNWIRRLFDLQVCSTYRSIKKAINQLKISNSDGGSVLEVGCGNQPYRHLFSSPIIYFAIDWEGAEEGFSYKYQDVIYYDGEHFPHEDKMFDVVFHTEVAEHVENLEQFFGECYRVLKDDGELLFSMPFSARYHYIPYDYWRLTPSSIKSILTKAGFKNIEIFSRSTDICVASYKVVTIGYKLVFSKKVLQTALAIFFAPIWLIALIIGQVSLHCDIGSEDDPLGWTVLCKK